VRTLLVTGMPAALRLVSGNRRSAPTPPPTPQEIEARRLVEEWVDTPFGDTRHALDDLVARVAGALGRHGVKPAD
jgi:hypothetical protein